MASAIASIDIAAPANAVWRVIGGFGSLPDWLPYIPTSELTEGGRVRHLINPEGGVIVERLMSFDERRRAYSYHILQAPFPVRDYFSTLQVEEIADTRSRVEWSGQFTPTTVGSGEASLLFRRIYEDGLRALAERFRS